MVMDEEATAPPHKLRVFTLYTVEQGREVISFS